MPRIEDFLEPYPPRKDLNLLFLISMPSNPEKADRLNHLLVSLVADIKNIAVDNCDYNARINVMNISSSVTWSDNNMPIDLDRFEWEWLPPGNVPNYSIAIRNLCEKLSRHRFQASVRGPLRPLIIFIADKPIQIVESELADLWNNKWYHHAIKFGFYTSTDSKKTLIDVIKCDDAVLEVEHIDVILQLLKPVRFSPEIIEQYLPSDIVTDFTNNSSLLPNLPPSDWDDSDW